MEGGARREVENNGILRGLRVGTVSSDTPNFLAIRPLFVVAIIVSHRLPACLHSTHLLWPSSPLLYMHS